MVHWIVLPLNLVKVGHLYSSHRDLEYTYQLGGQSHFTSSTDSSLFAVIVVINATYASIAASSSSWQVSRTGTIGVAGMEGRYTCD